MYRLLIVDDEAMIVDWLFEIFKEVKDLELDIYKAYSGDEAIDCFNRIKIDVLLADIKMPGMNGLELLKIVRSNWAECRVIFLTSYNEFNYIYTAIQYDGVSYLLKTEEDETIIETVKSAIKDIEKNLQMEKLIDEAQIQIQKALPVLQKDFLMDLLYGENCSLDTLVNQFRELEIHLDPINPVLMLLGRIDHVLNKITLKSKVDFIYRIISLIERHLSDSVLHIHIMIGNNIILWFIQPKESFFKESKGGNSYWEKFVFFIKGTLESIQNSAVRLFNVTLSFVLDDEPAQWNLISDRFSELQLLLDRQVGLAEGMIIERNSLFDKEPKTSVYNQVRMSTQLKRLKKIENFLECGQKKDYFEEIINLTEYIKENASFNHNPSLEIYYSIAMIILAFINRRNLTEKLAFKVGLYKLTRVEEHNSWSEAIEYIYNISNAIFQLQEEEQKNKTDEAIMRIKEYIYGNLNKDLSIITMAEMVHLNPSYLSRIYKQVTGTNLSDFITNAKLDKAKELLEKTNMKIYKVADSIGYTSQSYFIRFFKKSTGMTPQEYRLASTQNSK